MVGDERVDPYTRWFERTVGRKKGWRKDGRVQPVIREPQRRHSERYEQPVPLLRAVRPARIYLGGAPIEDHGEEVAGGEPPRIPIRGGGIICHRDECATHA